MSVVHRSRSIGIDWLADGPIGPYVQAFKQHLTECRYATSNLQMKEKALARLDAPDIKMRRYRAPDVFMRFLQTL